MCYRIRFLLLFLFIQAPMALAIVSVKDDAGHVVTLPTPAQRIISLAPHATELLFEAGAGQYVVGVSDYSDFPEQAKKIPSVGNIFALDIERILALKPDLIVVWGSGNTGVLMGKLKNTHIPVFESEPRDFETIATSIERLAILSGTQAKGNTAANKFRQNLQQLRTQYGADNPQQSPVRVFYQIAATPLMTINNQHIISSAIRLCGGKNIFEPLQEFSPTINREAVLAANPDAIIAAGGEEHDALNLWQQYPNMSAVQQKHLFNLNADWMNRAGPRFLKATKQLCQSLAPLRKIKRKSTYAK